MGIIKAAGFISQRLMSSTSHPSAGESPEITQSPIRQPPFAGPSQNGNRSGTILDEGPWVMDTREVHSKSKDKEREQEAQPRARPRATV